MNHLLCYTSKIMYILSGTLYHRTEHDTPIKFSPPFVWFLSSQQYYATLTLDFSILLQNLPTTTPKWLHGEWENSVGISCTTTNNRHDILSFHGHDTRSRVPIFLIHGSPYIQYCITKEPILFSTSSSLLWN